jgi:predicted regulator of Ras-like GTPase activity (Roadblock/LC7/MglB family)
LIAPKDALHRLRELSSEVRAAVLLDPHGDPVAHSEDDEALGAKLGEMAAELARRADAAAARHGLTAGQVEISSFAGAVFAVRGVPAGAEAPWTLAVVADRAALPSLMFMDIRHVIDQVEPAEAA